MIQGFADPEADLGRWTHKSCGGSQLAIVRHAPLATKFCSAAKCRDVPTTDNAPEFEMKEAANCGGLDVRCSSPWRVSSSPPAKAFPYFLFLYDVKTPPCPWSAMDGWLKPLPSVTGDPPPAGIFRSPGRAVLGEAARVPWPMLGEALRAGCTDCP
jgi:hypothetical protein